MITLHDIIAFAIGLLVGVAGGASAMWAVLRPINRVESVLARAESLLRNRDANG